MILVPVVVEKNINIVVEKMHNISYSKDRGVEIVVRA